MRPLNAELRGSRLASFVARRAKCRQIKRMDGVFYILQIASALLYDMELLCSDLLRMIRLRPCYLYLFVHYLVCFGPDHCVFLFRVCLFLFGTHSLLGRCWATDLGTCCRIVVEWEMLVHQRK